MTNIIAITNQKGGVGKTTTAINLGSALAEAHQKVLLVDFDPQGNVTSGVSALLDEEPENTVYDLICENCTFEEAVITGIYEKMDLLPADIQLSGVEAEFQGLDDRYEILKKALKQAAENYDYVLIDCPPSLGMLTVNALCAADFVIIPIQCEYYALEGLGQVVKTIGLVRQKFNPGLKVAGVLFTMYDQRTNLSNQVIETVKENLKEPIFNTVIPRNVRLAEAPSFGQPIIQYDSGSRGSESYRLLAAEVLRCNKSER